MRLGCRCELGFGSIASSVCSRTVWGDCDDARSVRGSAAKLPVAAHVDTMWAHDPPTVVP